MPSSLPIVSVAAPPPVAPPESTADRPRSGLSRRVLRRLLGAMLLVWGALLALWLFFHWGILYHIEQWRPQIEQRASAALGVSVRIGHIEVQSGRWVPALKLTDVTLADARGNTALRLPSVFVVVSPRSVLAFKPRLSQLLIDGAELEVRRDLEGRWHVGGLTLGDGTGDPRDSLDWLLVQREFVLRGGRLRWIDERHAAAPLEFESLQLVMRNTARRHLFRVDVTPPPELGAPLRLQAEFARPLLARPSSFERWIGTLQFDAASIDLGALADRTGPWPAAWRLPDAGQGALRAWIDWRAGHPWQATLDAALRGLELRATDTGEALRWAAFTGRLSASRDGAAYRLAGTRLDWRLDPGLSWRDGSFELAWQVQPGPAASLDGGRVVLENLDLALATHVARRLPLPQAARDRIEAGVPTGRVQQLELDWQGPPQQPRHYRIDARLQGLALAPGRAVPAAAEAGGSDAGPSGLARPGLRGLDLVVVANEAGGTAELALRDGALQLPGVLEPEALPVEELAGRLAWEVTPGSAEAPLPTFSLKAEGLRFRNEDASAVVDAAWQFVWPQGQGQGSVPDPGTGAAAGTGAAGAAVPASAPSEPAPGGGIAVAPVASVERAPRPAGAASASAPVPVPVPPWPGRLELDARLPSLPSQRLVRYLPLQIGPHTLDYLHRAIGEGQLREIRIELSGDLLRFPYREPSSGHFRVSGRVDGARFHYLPPETVAATGRPARPGAAASPRSGPDRPAAAPDGPPGRATGVREAADDPWPALERLSGQLLIDGRALRFEGAGARVQGLELRQVRGGIEPLGHGAQLRVDGEVVGPLDGMLDYVRETPVGRWLGGALAQARATGDAALQLGLDIPLVDVHEARVQGRLRLEGNDLRMLPDQPLLGAARGEVAFSEQGFGLKGVSAQVLGGVAQIEGGLEPGAAVELALQGHATVAALRQAHELEVVARLARLIEGEADYRATLKIGGGQRALHVHSDLVGVSAALPSPLGKPATTALPLDVDLRYEGGGEPASATASRATAAVAQLQTLEVRAADHLQLRLRHQIDAGGGARLLQGGLALSAPLRVPGRGLHAEIGGDRVDLDAWRQVLDRLEDAEPAPPLASGAAGPGGDGRGLLPDTVTVRTPALTAFGQQLSQVDASLSRDPGRWQLQLQSDQARGRIDYLPPSAVAGDEHPQGLLQARLQQLVLPPPAASAPPGRSAASEAAAAAASREAAAQASRMPALDIQVEQLWRQGRPLGRLEIQAVHPPEAPGDWRLDRVLLDSPDGRFEASGRWQRPAGAGLDERRMGLDFKLDAHDSGRLLERLGVQGALDGGAGQVQGTLGWRGSPLRPALATLDGRVRIDLGRGRFLKAEPGGAGRLLSVLSLQMLPRRLLFDFADVFGEGFAFDSVRGEAAIDGGVARIHDLRMRGVPAVVLLEGQVDLASETQDLSAFVVPEIDASAASIAAAVAVNPMVGLGTFVAQWLLRKPMAAAGTRQFRVTGSWAEPKVEPIERSAAAAERAAAAAAAEAGARGGAAAMPAATNDGPAASAPDEGPAPAVPASAAAPSGPADVAPR